MQLQFGMVSAMVHMDEKTPHMHLSFVPITQDGRLCAKEILGNKKKLTWWQDEFWKQLVEKYPDRLNRSLIYWKIQIFLTLVKIQIEH